MSTRMGIVRPHEIHTCDFRCRNYRRLNIGLVPRNRKFHLSDTERSGFVGSVAEISPRYARAHAVQSKSSSLVSVLVSKLTGLSWVEYRVRRESARAKASDSQVGTPTDLSVRKFPTSANWFFGQKIQRLMSPRLRTAACARLSAFWVATVNGQAMRSRRSLPRSCSAMACAISK